MSLPDEQPDFESYSLGQLYDIRDHLDTRSYPERAAIVERLIAEKEAAGIRLPSPSDVPLPWVLALAVLGMVLTVGVGYFQGLKAALVTALVIVLGVGFRIAFWGYLDGNRGDR